MKRTISLLSALAFVLVFSGSTFAQNGSSATSSTVNATATIQNQINFTTEQNLAFGKIPSNFSGVSIAPDQSGTPNFTNTGTGEQQGEVVIDSGSSTTTLLITINNPTTLDASSSSLGFNPNHVGEDATDLSTASSEQVATVDDGDSNNDYAIYLGGNLDDPGTGNSDPTSSLDAEQHTNTITVNVDFQ